MRPKSRKQPQTGFGRIIVGPLSEIDFKISSGIWASNLYFVIAENEQIWIHTNWSLETYNRCIVNKCVFVFLSIQNWFIVKWFSVSRLQEIQQETWVCWRTISQTTGSESLRIYQFKCSYWMAWNINQFNLNESFWYKH